MAPQLPSLPIPSSQMQSVHTQVQEIPEVQKVESDQEIAQKVRRLQVVGVAAEAPKICPPEYGKQHTVGQIVDVPVPQMVEESMKEERLLPQECMQQPMMEHVSAVTHSRQVCISEITRGMPEDDMEIVARALSEPASD